MESGALTGYIDVAQLVLYAFWIFFAGLVYYLRREDKREGYPLEPDRARRSRRVRVQGFPAMPAPKTFLLPHGGEVQAPKAANEITPDAVPASAWAGTPLVPVGNPMLSGVGPAAYALRADVPDQTIDGDVRLRPMRVASDFSVEPRDPDPRGMRVEGSDGVSAGRVSDIWIDRSEPQIRYLEVETAPDGKRVLVPIALARITRQPPRVIVKSVLGSQFALAPALASPDQITLREEDRTSAYFASGNLFATPERAEPIL
jgi:photosynthetic reaction center H subunit